MGNPKDFKYYAEGQMLKSNLSRLCKEDDSDAFQKYILMTTVGFIL